MIERHQDYQLTIPTLPVGGLANLQLKLDSDAAFAARLVKTRNFPLAAGGIRFKNRMGDYTGSGFMSNLLLQVAEPSRGDVQWPQLVYPASASISIDVQNLTGAPLTNVRILFRGSKLYEDGQMPAPVYPEKYEPLAFAYPVVVSGIPLVTAGSFNDRQLLIADDGDFALRYGFCDSFRLQVTNQVSVPAGASALYNELYVTLRDEARKPYSNEPIHVDDLFGSVNTTNADSPLAFVWPGLFTPEIYIERNHSLYFDIRRSDTGFVGPAGTCDLHFRFCGMKVLYSK